MFHLAPVKHHVVVPSPHNRELSASNQTMVSIAGQLCPLSTLRGKPKRPFPDLTCQIGCFLSEMIVLYPSFLSGNHLGVYQISPNTPYFNYINFVRGETHKTSKYFKKFQRGKEINHSFSSSPCKRLL